MDRKVKAEPENNVVFNLDNNTQLEFLNNRKTVVIIDKDRFLVCKQLMLDNASDDDFASFLNIPHDKVRCFKHQMQLFEDSIRVRRRAARLNAQRRNSQKQPAAKKELSSEERYKRARELIGKNYGTNQISKILKISERSVTRFKKRIRDEKRRLRAEGKIPALANDGDDENSFKYLKMNEKIERAKELFRQRLKISEISEQLKISERSVRRWKDRLAKMESEPEKYQAAATAAATTSSSRIRQRQLSSNEDEEEEEEESKPKRKRRTYLDREKVQYASELIENGLSNKEMSMLLEMSIACVRKLKMKILDGSVDELIDDSEEHYNRLNSAVVTAAAPTGRIVESSDPLNVLHDYSPSHLFAPLPLPRTSERKAKAALSDRDMFIVRLLRENSIRTMDIAKLLGISERSVTRLLSKSRDYAITEYEPDVIEEVQRLIATKDNILNEVIEECEDPNATGVDESKEDLGMRLIAMNTKVKDVANMLDVSQKTVQKWKLKLAKSEVKQEVNEEEEEDDVPAKEEYIIEYLE